MLGNTVAASDEEVTQLSIAFNMRMREVYEAPSWIKLFKAIDSVRLIP